MIVDSSGRPTRSDIARQHVEQAFGPSVAKRLDTFEDGTFYITAGDLTRLLSWFVDFTVYLLCAGVGFVVFAFADREIGFSESAVVFLMLGLLVGTPILYGLFYGNGRAVGAVLTGTRLVRLGNGGRIGFAACWAMLVRTLLFPLLLLAFVFSGSVGPGSLSRVSIDDGATRRLHEAGLLNRDSVRLH